ncbi:MAG: class I SAM-dependent methyltransferase [Gloeomargarita sp. DG02_4_bins_56]
MTAASKKNFADIREDYQFFAAHTTEFEQDLQSYRQVLSHFPIPEKPLKFLDFGCGTGVFTSRFLSLLHLPPQELAITLVEPDAVYRQNAVHILSAYTAATITDYAHLPAETASQFHLILSNHVLYYVPDLQHTVKQLLKVVHPQGMLLIAMAGRENVISQFWQKCFDRLGQPIPYYLAEDLTACLDEYHPGYQRRKINYEVNFPDTAINRRKLLRFMLGDHLEQLPASEVLSLFDPYACKGQIQIKTSHEQFLLTSLDVLPMNTQGMIL